MNGERLYARAKVRIPGGTQLLSKRPETFLPGSWPAYYSRAKGVLVWDLDGREFVDMSLMGVGACVLGYADADVDRAVVDAISRGSMCTLNAPEEVELAELLCDLHGWAQMVRYARSGGEAMAIAVRIARAATGRDKVAFCGYHGWHDWYLAANLADDANLDGHLLPGLDPAGVPRGLTGTALPFEYNDEVELDRIVSQHAGELSAIVIEPLRSTEPRPGFLEHIRDVASRIGAVLIFDEITSGFRAVTGGIHLAYRAQPDIAVFAKAMSNGYPMAAVIGRASVMDHVQRTFISSTSWTDRIGPAAALATIEKHRREGVPDHLAQIGQAIRKGWVELAGLHGLLVSLHGTAALGHFQFEHGEMSRAMHTFFNQGMLERGFLASKAFYASLSHTDDHVGRYLECVEEVFGQIARGIETGDLGTMVKGPLVHVGFARLA